VHASGAHVSDERRRVFVVGTAGHVDHGKSALVRALTGTDPDRLAEEKARGLTIDLGFAWCQLPGGAIASLVDVPGHEDFIRNMLAGAGGIRAALMVIAADEGPMPQTREHLAILDQLRVGHAVIALTKADLVEDEWLSLVADEARELVTSTTLHRASVIPVSAHTGRGLDELRGALDHLAEVIPPVDDRGRPRLSVDRVFTVAGFGTVVTGTLRDGALRAGEVLELLPSGRTARARGLQTHGSPVDTAPPGTRVAVNVTGLDTDAVRRGDILARPGDYAPTRLLDASVELLPSARDRLRHDDGVVLFHGAAEIPGRVRLIGGDSIEPGGEGYVQVHLRQPTVLVAGDRFVLRLASPSETIGGGSVLDPAVARRHRRFRGDVVARFDALAEGSPEERLAAQLEQLAPCRAEDLDAVRTGLEEPRRAEALEALRERGEALRLGGGELWMTAGGWRKLSRRLRELLAAYHARHPLKVGPPPEELRERLGLSPHAFAAVLAQAEGEGWLARGGGRGAPHLAEHAVELSASQERAAAQLLARFTAAPYAPPGRQEAETSVGADVLEVLLARGDLVAVEMDVLFDRRTYDHLTKAVVERIRAHGSLSVADVRDEFDTSRKYALGLLEHLDRVHITRRMGDSRVLGVRAAGVGTAADGAKTAEDGEKRKGAEAGSETERAAADGNAP